VEVSDPTLKRFSLGALMITLFVAPPSIAVLVALAKHGMPFPALVITGLAMFWSQFLAIAILRTPE